jgi:aldehyde dehydrogenase (NAD+)
MLEGENLQVEKSVQFKHSSLENYDRLFIDGKWRPGRSVRIIENMNPYSREVISTLHCANAQDIEEAYQAAANAQPAWAKLPPQEKRQVLINVLSILNDKKEEIIHLLIKETGSTRAKAELEWNLVYQGTLEASTYPFHISGSILPTSIPSKEGYVFRKPVGVVGIISPWDFSLQLTNRSLAPALATGNAVVLKPASSTPITGGLLFGKIYEEAGLPPGVLNIVIGSGQDIGDAFVEHPVPRVITFTGSTKVGRHIGMLCGKNLKRVSLELGGNSPLVVLQDADLDQAVDIAVFGKFLNAGQICMSINRIIIDEHVYEEFQKRFIKKVRSLKWGDPSQENVSYGPIIDEKQFKHIKELIEDTLKAGAKLLLDGPSEGLVMHPVVLGEVSNDMPAAQQEIFGPVAVLIKARDAEEALRLANETDYGLSSAVCTRNLGEGFALAKRMQAGMSHVNDITINDEPNSPFGGEKQSGLGRFGGEWAIREFTTDHWITVQHAPREYPF